MRISKASNRPTCVHSGFRCWWTAAVSGLQVLAGLVQGLVRSAVAGCWLLVVVVWRVNCGSVKGADLVTELSSNSGRSIRGTVDGIDGWVDERSAEHSGG